jgi:hypothetical protein
VSKTRICLSCHLGNVAQGKIITHEMYAAGHPPLPAFELATFTAQEPEHWRRLGEKDPAIRDKFLEETKTQFEPADLHQTREVLVAALVTMSESLKLNLDLAKSSGNPVGEHSQWPELANYSCFACHHELQTSSWRQARMKRTSAEDRRVMVPGRPVPHEWPFSLAQIAARVAGRTDLEFEEQVDVVLSAYAEQPFGDPATLDQPIGGVIDWTNGLAEQLADGKAKIDGTEVLLLICDRAAEANYDYDSSRQLLWAFERVYSETKATRNGAVALLPDPEADENSRRPRYSSSIDECMTPGWPAQREDAIENMLFDVNDVTQGPILVLDLRQGQCSILEAALKDEEDPRGYVPTELSKTLPPISKYDPQRIIPVIKQLREALEKSR